MWGTTMDLREKKSGQASSGCVSSPAELVLEVGERGVNQAAVKVWPLVL